MASNIGNRLRLAKRGALVFVMLLIVTIATALLLQHPSNHRRWIVGQQVLPAATFRGDSVIIRAVRNFSYAKDGTPFPNYETRAYDLSRIETAWFILAPFESDNRGPAHTFLSFGFSDSQFVAVSVESRREINEDYSILRGLLRSYELMYVVGDERDLIGLRVTRGDQVYVYPIKAAKEKVRRLFVQMLERANHLSDNPEFYNTLTNNCTTNILHHANSIATHQIPYGREVLLPGYADELAKRLGLLDTDLSIEEARRRYYVNERAIAYARDPFFSVKIRNSQ
ncbi:MAG TPA: DUF4105 domain-containing protein [Longimicrobiales bacterium]|nr:DUF4105 domain-containing protein [Longimicrobiales bacterium]